LIKAGSGCRQFFAGWPRSLSTPVEDNRKQKKGRITAMLAELSIMPLGGDTHTSDKLAEVLKLIDAFGLPYQLTPTGTCIEGEWGELMELIHECHNRVRAKSPHVITLIKIEDDEGQKNKLTRNVVSVEQKVGRKLQKVEV